LQVSVVIPCLNEAAAIARCVQTTREALDRAGVSGEIIVVDNASDDRSGEVAGDAGATVVHEPVRGYGSACRAGFRAARGDYIVMLDADLTYDSGDISKFICELEGGADLVMGNRMRGIETGAMPWLHRYVGNPVLSRTLNLFFDAGVHDAHCGMRALRRKALPALDLRTNGMEFASEVIVKAAKTGLRFSEVDIRYHPREGESKLSRFRDGWRHLRFLLVQSPTWLFLVPGTVMAALGTVISLIVLLEIPVFGRTWELHSMVAGMLLMVVGAQVLALGLCARAYGTYHMGEHDRHFDRLRERVRLEHVLVAGALVAAAGFVLAAVIVGIWLDRGFGALAEERLAIFAATLIVIGVEIFFTAFLISIIGLRRRA
jgi:hypothetical protein